MNKTQINYLTERLNILKKRAIKEYKEKQKPISSLSPEQKIGMILKNEVSLKLKDLDTTNCPYWLTHFFKGFDFSEYNNIVNTQKAERDKRQKRVESKLEEQAHRMVDDFVLKGVADTKVIEIFQKFIQKVIK